MRILLADDDAARAGALVNVLAADPGLTVLRPGPGELLSDAVASLAPDVILVDMARPDRDALEGIRVAVSSNPRPIVLFVDQDDPAFMEEAIRAGVSSYNVLGVPPPDVKPILRAAAAMFRQHQSARSALRQAERRLLERETVDRAKAILIRERHMAEPDAYRWLRKRAMASGRRIPDVAQEVVRDQAGGQSKERSEVRLNEPMSSETLNSRNASRARDAAMPSGRDAPAQEVRAEDVRAEDARTPGAPVPDMPRPSNGPGGGSGVAGGKTRENDAP